LEACLACDLSSGRQALPGGRIFATEDWVVEHCVGPLGVGTLVLKPLRHCTAVASLSPSECAQLGPLLQQTAACVRELTGADQVYVCLWSHADWVPGHIHFVVQPVWAHLRREHAAPGPTLQAELFATGRLPPAHEVEALCGRARRWSGWAGPGS
jgi:diadenosine tetraphosphate (Ap4A) HIT family hydrolase